jgi:hypothetical protein
LKRAQLVMNRTIETWRISLEWTSARTAIAWDIESTYKKTDSRLLRDRFESQSSQNSLVLELDKVEINCPVREIYFGYRFWWATHLPNEGRSDSRVSRIRGKNDSIANVTGVRHLPFVVRGPAWSAISTWTRTSYI